MSHLAHARHLSARAANAHFLASICCITRGVTAESLLGYRPRDLRKSRTIRSQASVPLRLRTMSSWANVSSPIAAASSVIIESPPAFIICPPGIVTITRHYIHVRRKTCGAGHQISHAVNQAPIDTQTSINRSVPVQFTPPHIAPRLKSPAFSSNYAALRVPEDIQ